MTHKTIKELYANRVNRQKLKEAPKIAVVGDVMLDVHLTCEVLGLSPEADLAWKLKQTERRYSLGGAANVAANLISLGANVLLTSVVGQDDAGHRLDRMVCALDRNRCRNRIYFETASVTTQKTRLITAAGAHIARIDEETRSPVAEGIITCILDEIRKFKPEFIVVSDYNKGIVDGRLMSALLGLGILCIVDPKAPLIRYGPVYLATPNEKELYTLAGCEGGIMAAVMRLNEQSRISDIPEHLLVKLGGRGASLHTYRRTHYREAKLFGAHLRTHGDPAGCGDSLLAGVAYGLGCGWDLEDAIKLGVAAGSVAFDQIGVCVVTPEQLWAELGKGEPKWQDGPY